MSKESFSPKARKIPKAAAEEAEAVESTHVFLRNVNVGDSFSGVYYLDKVFIKVARTGSKYSDLTLRDRSGNIFAKFWGEVTSTTGGDWVEINAHVEEYQGNKNIIVKNITLCDAPAELANYLPMSDTIAEDTVKFKELIELVQAYDAEAGCDSCSAVVGDVFKNGFVPKFELSPASAFPCYGRLGGLLSYTVRVATMVNDTMVGFNLTAQEKSIALAAALLHRVGAAYAFEMADCMPKETIKGALVGPLNIGFAKIVNAVNRITISRREDTENPVNDDVFARLMHAVVSSDTTSIPPMTREAIALHGAVAVVRELSDASDFISHDTNPHERFTSYDAITKRRFFKGE